jgi:hypothetical protein
LAEILDTVWVVSRHTLRTLMGRGGSPIIELVTMMV